MLRSKKKVVSHLYENFLRMSLAVTLGVSTTAIFTTLTNDLIVPLLEGALNIKGGLDKYELSIGSYNLKIGSFTITLINYLLVFITIFIIIINLHP